MNWLPPNGSLQGIELDHLLRWNLAAVFWLFVAANVVLVLAMLWRRRRRPDGSSANPARLILFAEVIPLVAVTALYIWMGYTGHELWGATHEQGLQAAAIPVEITGVQFQWYFRYAGPDGAFGATRAALVNAPAGNPLGLDPQDRRSLDDVVSPILVVPAGRQIDLRLRSLDVIHGFSIPGMRLKQDTVPGMISHLRFTPEVPGDYPILCSQVCGLGHARMQARLRVVSADEFEAWLAGRARFTLAGRQSASVAATDRRGGRS